MKWTNKKIMNFWTIEIGENQNIPPAKPAVDSMSYLHSRHPHGHRATTTRS
jgi:hypothetical protein